jgi:alpha-beta hydrolase superfamily lysophospholipase
VWPVDDVVEGPTWLGADESPLFGWFAAPQDLRVRGGVVICPPLGEEARSARRTLRELAIRLAAEGFLVLRTDYPGTGDSAGDLNEVVDDRWAGTVDAAVRFMTDAGCERVALVGMRMGATIAAVAAARAPQPPTALVMWDPCQSGRSFLREQAMLHNAMREASGSAPTGSVATPGYVYGPSEVAALSALSADAAAQLDSERTDVTVLFRDDRPTPSALADRLATAGFTIDRSSGQDELLNVSPLDAVVPESTVNAIVSTLSEAMGTSEPRTVHPDLRASTIVRTDVGPVTERFVEVGSNRLFGIETRSAADGVEVMFLNVANESHIGPARLWTTLARRWAAEGGLTATRLDFTGLGDSPDVGGRSRETPLEPGWIDDLDEIVAERHTDGRELVLVGLCSGAYAGFEAALRGTVTGVIAINPMLDSIDTTVIHRRPEVTDPRRRAVRLWPDRLFRLAIKHRRVAQTLWRLLQQTVPSRAAMGVPGAVIRRGTRVHLALGREDRPPFDVGVYWRLRLPRLRRRGLFERSDSDALDHSALVLQGRDELAAALNRHVARHYYAPAPIPESGPRLRSEGTSVGSRV